MFIKLLQKIKFIKRIICYVARIRARELVSRVRPYIEENDLLLDVGSGTCNVSEVLMREGVEAIPLDVRNLSFVEGMEPVIYDGKTIPYENDHFNLSMILTVLHHTEDPEHILKEVKRVSKKIVIIEDIYANRFHKYVTFFFDSLMNPGYHKHPHTNKSDGEWKKTFESMGLTLVEAKYKYSFIVFKQATYYLEK